MPQFSDDQLNSIAQQLRDLATAIGEFRLDRIRAGVPLTDPGIVQLLGLQMSMLQRSSSFYAEAAQTTLEDADKAAMQISQATDAANAAIKTLQSIDRVVSIGSAAAVLATAVMSGDINQIAAGAKGVYAAIND